jgi:hypothetical protein
MRVRTEMESGRFSAALGRGFSLASELRRLIDTGAPEVEVREKFLDLCFLEGLRTSTAQRLLRLHFDYGPSGIEAQSSFADTTSQRRPLAACYELRKAVEWVPGPRLRERIEKLLGDQALLIHTLEARGDLRKARWQVACTWALMITMIVSGPIVAVMRLIPRIRG